MPNATRYTDEDVLEWYDYALEHTRIETADHFNISEYTITRRFKMLGLKTGPKSRKPQQTLGGPRKARANNPELEPRGRIARPSMSRWLR